MNKPSLTPFLRESNLIEGITRDPTADEIDAAEHFVRLVQVGVAGLCSLQAVIAPGKPLREKLGMNVRVGQYVAPRGGPQIRLDLAALLLDASESDDPWEIHIAYEHLHPFMDGNGRTGRLLWVWQMHRLGQDPCGPFSIPFLHRFYYQTLARENNYSRGPKEAA